jgi:hypothetical protein
MNPLEFKHLISGQPYRLARRVIGPLGEDTDNFDLLTLALGTASTIGMNVAAPFSLLQSGVRGNRYLSHVDFVRHSPFPVPLFNYVTPGSAAEKFGAKLGGKVGARKIGARVAGRLIPGLGWGLLAYDVYDVAVNRSLWGFDL